MTMMLILQQPFHLQTCFNQNDQTCCKQEFLQGNEIERYFLKDLLPGNNYNLYVAFMFLIFFFMYPTVLFEVLTVKHMVDFACIFFLSLKQSTIIDPKVFGRFKQVSLQNT